MMAWIKDTLKAESADDKIIWKASAMHHPMFGLHYDDYQSIINDFLPLIKAANFDAFFNGHEHLQNYANTDSKQFFTDFQLLGIDPKDQKSNCSSSAEWFPQHGKEETERSIEFKKG
jgi:hypothetical protein